MNEVGFLRLSKPEPSSVGRKGGRWGGQTGLAAHIGHGQLPFDYSALFKSLNVYGKGEREPLVLDEVSEVSGFGTSR